MSLITRCPACGTMFKVVPDQLKISEGWVRCGHCAEVFDATAFLQGDAARGAASAAPASAQAAISRTESVAADAGPESEGFASSLHSEVSESEGLPSEGPDSALLEAAAEALREDPLDRPFEFRREDRAHPEEMEREQPLRITGPARLAPEAEPELDELSFVQEARRKEFWNGHAVRVALMLLLLVLGALLVAQVALHDRDRLAAADPALRPWLARLCATLRCTIRPPRQIDAIAIDSSSFNKLRPDAYRLNFTLKNQAATDVAMPALELTLTDSQDQALLRRVVMPAELGPNAVLIPATSEWSGSVALAVAANEATSSRIAGYRLLAFYP
jgi:predicted Zn finger-like uncharacterized protein